EDDARAGENQAQPEDEASEDWKPLPHRQTAVLSVAPGVAAARRQLPDPADEQHPGYDEQPEILRLRKSHGFEVDAQHASLVGARGWGLADAWLKSLRAAFSCDDS